MAYSVTGIISVTNVLTNELRLIVQWYLLQHQERLFPCEHLVTALCDIKAYTQFEEIRSFGVSLLYIDWDKHYDFQLYESNPV